jgi:hypothetical protein
VIIAVGIFRRAECSPVAVVADFDSSVHIAEFYPGSTAADLATHVMSDEMMMHTEAKIVGYISLHARSLQVRFGIGRYRQIQAAIYRRQLDRRVLQSVDFCFHFAVYGRKLHRPGQTASGKMPIDARGMNLAGNSLNIQSSVD